MSGKRSETKDFSHFENFINCQGIPKETAEAFRKFLKDFYNLTQEFWRPRQCHFIPGLRGTAENLAKIYFPPGTEVRAASFWQRHDWLEICPPCPPSLIVDPTGLPPLWSEKFGPKPESAYQPFFGPLNNAPSFLQEAYRKGQELVVPRRKNF